MRIGEVARRAGVNIETLRYYERRGLIAEPGRSPAGHRSYDDDTVRFVRAVKDAQSLGFTLAEIEEYLELARRAPGRASEELRVRLATKIEEVDAKVGALRRMRGELARVLGCACDSLDRCTCGAAYLSRRGREPDAGSSDPLHVTNGESAGNTLRQTGLGGAVLSWQDVLHEGPVPALPPARLRERRAAYLSACGWGERRTILHSLEHRDRLLRDRLAAGSSIVLWFEHDLHDQLELVQVLAQIADAGSPIDAVSLIEVGAFSGRPDFHGLGELAAAELETLWPERRALSEADVAAGRDAWAALRSPDPYALEGLLGAELPERPFLQPAVRRLLEELPDVRTGLARSERQLLGLLARSDATPGQLFVGSQQLEEAPFAGDAWVWRRLAELGAGAHPLVALQDGGSVPSPPPLGDGRVFAHAPLAITELGRAVLAGEEDRVGVLGIDRWLGGSHLLPDQLWRWDAAAGAVVAG